MKNLYQSIDGNIFDNAYECWNEDWREHFPNIRIYSEKCELVSDVSDAAFITFNNAQERDFGVQIARIILPYVPEEHLLFLFDSGVVCIWEDDGEAFIYSEEEAISFMKYNEYEKSDLYHDLTNS